MLFSLVGWSAFTTGCTSPTKIAQPVPIDTERVGVWDRNGTPSTWDVMIDDLASVDAVFLGEEHDDGAGHAIQREIVKTLFERWNGGVLTLEMLERHEQVWIDEWMEGSLSKEELRDLTHSNSWCGEGSWDAWYQPILDEAIEHGGIVIAGNAPRPLVRTAGRDGYEALPCEGDVERADFDLPSIDHPLYRADLRALMIKMRTDDKIPDPVVTDDEVELALRSLLVWDATMGSSAASARSRGRVIHMAGHFHIDRNGGTVAEFRAHRPSDSVRTVTVRQGAGWNPTDHPDVLGAADWLIGSTAGIISSTMP